ncbi:ribonuclease P protein subunit p30 [Venturia canescens]|uniref:ribonuclease P protein subunit p30 n=1 Tax=Venturia canescens TaxID=32260 RepID=UPI001C9C3454|nr:ribonuclease P protein subunit p30 [Venturia canescens]XP_043275521.1 ribonuclease P protein subunit p30 [Venturia canescens]XP_043275522.1 ribonuclease P protein subunit p30 [Venturia canescens]
MRTYSGFCDFCVNPDDKNPQTIRQILLQLYRLGYETVAINQTVDESIFENEKKKKKKGADNEIKSTLPEPFNLTELKNEFADKLVILSRITFVFGDSSKIHTLTQSQILKKYDLYGLVPKTQAALQFACSQSNADIVTLKSCYSGLKFNRKLYLQAVERGVHFEIQYADVVNESTRKYALHYSHLFYIFGRSRNVIISSGATNHSLIRNPYDVINLAFLLGLNETKAKASVLAQCKHLLLKAEGRRYGKAVFAIYTNVDESETGEQSAGYQSNKRKKIS